MAVFDYSLEELEAYKGINPCPEDIDQFWDQSVKQLDDFDWNVVLEKAEFQAPYADCFDLTFTGFGDVRVYAKYLRPKNIDKPGPGLVHFHGYKCASEDWSGLLKYAAAGVSVAALDCRGQGGKSRDKSDVAGSTSYGHIIRGLEDGREHLMYRSIFLDTVQLARILMSFPETDETRMGATGESQGGALTLACASLEPRIRYTAPVFPFLSDYKRVWEMESESVAYDELFKHFRLFDPHHKREAEIFNILGYIDVKNLVHRIRGKVLMGISLMDKICPPSTQFAAYNNINCEKDRVLYYEYGHEVLPGMQDEIFSFLMEMGNFPNS